MSSDELYELDDTHIDELLQHVVDSKGSELHLSTGMVPGVRVYGVVKRITAYERLRTPVLRRMIDDLLTNEQIEELDKQTQLEFDYTTADRTARFNATISQDRVSITAVFTLLASGLEPFPED